MSETIDRAISILNSGGIIGLPTETVYGLAGAIHLPQSIEKIFTTKNRPFFDPLIVHVSSIDMARKLTSDWSPLAHALAEKFWPGPLTLVLPKSNQVSDMITAGLQSVGIRMPQHPVALDVISRLAVPLAAPSANKFGKTSPTMASHVNEEFKDDNLFVLDGGPCEVGLESTVLLIKRGLDRFEMSILRAGQITKSDIEKSLEDKNIQFQFVDAVSKAESPGHMKHHYMPKVPLVLNESGQTENEIKEKVKARLPELPDQVDGVKILKPTNLDNLKELVLSSDPTIAARELYAKLREIADSGAEVIYFNKKSNHTGEKWEAIFDRLSKAASLII